MLTKIQIILGFRPIHPELQPPPFPTGFNSKGTSLWLLPKSPGMLYFPSAFSDYSNVHHMVHRLEFASKYKGGRKWGV